MRTRLEAGRPTRECACFASLERGESRFEALSLTRKALNTINFPLGTRSLHSPFTIYPIPSHPIHPSLTPLLLDSATHDYTKVSVNERLTANDCNTLLAIQSFNPFTTPRVYPLLQIAMQAQMLEIHDDPFGLKPISVLDDDKMQEVADYISSPVRRLIERRTSSPD